MNQNLDCNNVCHKINNLIQNYIKEHNTVENRLLVIEIKEVSDFDNIPKLEVINQA
jgi:hypothetical protein